MAPRHGVVTARKHKHDLNVFWTLMGRGLPKLFMNANLEEEFENDLVAS